MSDYILSATDITVGYNIKKNEKVVLSHLNLSLERGKLTCLFGANGTGKSTLLRTLSGVQPALDGKILLYGSSDLNSLSRQELAKIISIVNTDYTAAGALSVEEVVSLGRYPYTGFFGVLSGDDKKVTENAIASVGLTHLKDRHIATLSDGERQKAMIARALAQDTPVIILDEPTSFLDAASRIETLSLLKNLTREFNKAVLVSTHDISQSLAQADNLWLLTSDKSLICGKVSDIIAEKGTLDRLFQGRNVTFSKERLDFVPKQ